MKSFDSPFKILFVEDNDQMRKLLISRARAKMGCECLSDDTGLDTVTIALLNQPDVIVLDMNLPEISGFSIIRELKRTSEVSHIPVIVYSAHNHPDVVDYALELGASEYYSKDKAFGDLFDLIYCHTKLKSKEMDVR